MGKGSYSAPTPDPQIGKAAVMSAQTGQDMLNFMQNAYKDYSGRQATTDSLANQVTQQNLSTAQQQAGWAAEDRARYQSEFVPLQNDLVSKAQNWDSASRENSVADAAGAAVQAQGDLARQQTDRTLAASGVNPASGRYVGATRAADLATGLAVVGAQNNARQQVRQQALNLEAEAINMGNGLPTQASQATTLGLSAGNSALGANTAANASFLNGTGLMTSGYNGAMTGLNSEMSGLNTLYNSQANAYAQAQSAASQNTMGIGSMLGGIAGIATLI